MIGEKYIARSSAIAARLIGGEMMIMSAVDSTFFTLNEVATLIWQAADGRTPLSAIVSDKICPEFEVDAGTPADQLERHAMQLPRVADSLSGNTPKKVVAVVDRIVNIVL